MPRALELAERYRLLGEPEQAVSICKDVLTIEADNPIAIRTLFLALTETFGHRRGATIQEAEQVASSFPTEYDKIYYAGVAAERWGRALHHKGAHAAMAGDWIRRAMTRYEKAEAIRPSGNDDVLLRWNACVRLLESDPDMAEREHEPMDV